MLPGQQPALLPCPCWTIILVLGGGVLWIFCGRRQAFGNQTNESKSALSTEYSKTDPSTCHLEIHSLYPPLPQCHARTCLCETPLFSQELLVWRQYHIQPDEQELLIAQASRDLTLHGATRTAYIKKSKSKAVCHREGEISRRRRHKPTRAELGIQKETCNDAKCTVPGHFPGHSTSALELLSNNFHLIRANCVLHSTKRPRVACKI